MRLKSWYLRFEKYILPLAETETLLILCPANRLVTLSNRLTGYPVSGTRDIVSKVYK